MTENEKTALAVLLIGALSLLGGGAVLRRIPRGIENNNPGNIRRTGIDWRGEIPDAEKTDPDFEQFTAPEWGIRAMAREIKTSLARGQQTIRAIITEWAPPSENPTEQYIANVAARTGIDADEQLVETRDMPAIIDAIIVQENGSNPYPADLIRAGIGLA